METEKVVLEINRGKTAEQLIEAVFPIVQMAWLIMSPAFGMNDPRDINPSKMDLDGQQWVLMGSMVRQILEVLEYPYSKNVGEWPFKCETNEAITA